MEPSPLDTSLECFVAVARYHGVDLSVDRIKHDYALTQNDAIDRLLPSIARRSGFRAKKVKLRWNDLKRLGEAYPIIARLKNGTRVIVLGFRDNKVGVVDPTAKEPQVLSFDKKTFRQTWKGEALLLRRNYKFTDESRPFGFTWFLPEILRNFGTFRDIIVAAVMLQVLALE
jgi:ATP-binding cassette subfamily B protein